MDCFSEQKQYFHQRRHTQLPSRFELQAQEVFQEAGMLEFHVHNKNQE
jgi:hypothetical protein